MGRALWLLVAALCCVCLEPKEAAATVGGGELFFCPNGLRFGASADVLVAGRRKGTFALRKALGSLKKPAALNGPSVRAHLLLANHGQTGSGIVSDIDGCTHPNGHLI